MPKGRREKKPKHKKIPPPLKKPRVDPDLISPDKEYISWHFEHLEKEGEWGWCALEKDDIWNNIYPKLINFEKKTWNEILVRESRKNHSIPISDLCRAARNLLESKFKYIDFDELISLRFSGQQRLWGIRSGSIFKILWWDPNHQVCPANKRHT